METNIARDAGLPDISEQIDIAVGHLTMLSQRIATGNVDRERDAPLVDKAMLLLAGLQGVVAYEPAPELHRLSDYGLAEEIESFAEIGPRPPAVRALLEQVASRLFFLHEHTPFAPGTFAGYSLAHVDDFRTDMTVTFRIYESRDKARRIAADVVEALADNLLMVAN